MREITKSRIASIQKVIDENPGNLKAAFKIAADENNMNAGSIANIYYRYKEYFRRPTVNTKTHISEQKIGKSYKKPILTNSEKMVLRNAQLQITRPDGTVISATAETFEI